MMEIIAYVALAYLAVQILVALANLLSGQSLKKGIAQSRPMVSILVPARNEEENIGNLLEDMIALDYSNLEILVYDDDSSDRTASIIIDKSLKDSRIRYIKGNGPLPGWLGKNYGCHRLARLSRGEYLLFMDADVRVRPDLITDAISCMQRSGTDLLSLFPVQRMNSLGEWLTVPLMNRILVGNLPLLFVRLAPWPAFAAANGQFMMFRSEAYKNYWFHKKVSNEKVEDILISKRMKSLGLKVQTLLSGGQVSCRMYHGFNEGIEGFSKNVHAFFGKNWLILFLYVLLTTLGPFAVWLSISISAMLIYLAFAVIFRALVSLQSRQAIFLNLILMPMQQVSLLVIATLAAYRQFTGKHYWKGRRVGR